MLFQIKLCLFCYFLIYLVYVAFSAYLTKITTCARHVWCPILRKIYGMKIVPEMMFSFIRNKKKTLRIDVHQLGYKGYFYIFSIFLNGPMLTRILNIIMMLLTNRSIFYLLWLSKACVYTIFIGRHHDICSTNQILMLEGTITTKDFFLCFYIKKFSVLLLSSASLTFIFPCCIKQRI